MSGEAANVEMVRPGLVVDGVARMGEALSHYVLSLSQLGSEPARDTAATQDVTEQLERIETHAKQGIEAILSVLEVDGPAVDQSDTPAAERAATPTVRRGQHVANRHRALRGQQSDHGLKLSYDRKVSPSGTYQASRRRWVAKTPNSFGLPSHKSCPGATEFCNGCYGTIAEQSSGVGELLDHNLHMLQEAETQEAMTALLIDMVGKFAGEANRTDLPANERIFRIHWNGDFFSEAYAEAWKETMAHFPDIAFWAYTRSFKEPVNVVPLLADVPNLALYLSTDAWNRDEALAVRHTYPKIGLAFSTHKGGTKAELLKGWNAVDCPESVGRMELMTGGVGACVSCAICPTGKSNVVFYEAAGKPQI